MESCARLRALLTASLAARVNHSGQQDLFDALAAYTPALRALFDIPPRSASEQRELESGKTTVHGSQLAVNADFARQALFLAAQLDCSERAVSGLLQDVMAAGPNLGPEQCVEAAIEEFHRRRRDKAESVRLLLEGARASAQADAPPLCRRLDEFVRMHLVPPPSPTRTAASLSVKIFDEIVRLGGVIERAQTTKQNAVSNTALQQGANATLGFDVLQARCDSLVAERRTLARSLFTIAQLGYLSAGEVQKHIEWLSENPHHPVTFYILSGVLSAFEPNAPELVGEPLRQQLARDSALITFLRKKLDPNTKWSAPGLKATVLLKWTLFLTEARHRDSALEHREGFRTEELETQVWNAVQGDTFTYLAQSTLRLQRQDIAQDMRQDLPTADFVPAVLEAFEGLVRWLIRHASSELRKIKQRQEDLVLAGARPDRSRMGRQAGALPPSDGSAPRNDIVALFEFIGVLYSALPAERALQFWGSAPLGAPTYLEHIEGEAPRLAAFLQWAVWSTQAKDVAMATALHEMLAGLAKGRHCSELAYNFVARGGGDGGPASSSVSWVMVFGLLDSWAAAASAPRAQPSGTQGSWQPRASTAAHTLGPAEVLFAQAFLRLLGTVARHSVAVRTALAGHAHLRAIPTLVALLPLPVPLELKGALFGALAAFCEPGAGAAGAEICRAVWMLMERLEVINVRGGAVNAKGVELELEQVEAAYKVYPATMPFLRLLCTLIHTPKRVPAKERLTETTTSTIPDMLGQPYRLPGVGPFTAFVLDDVFAKIPAREFARASDRWEMNDLCLCYVERCLGSYELESLVTTAEAGQLSPDTLLPFLLHPGFDIMKRLLTASPLQATLLTYLVEGVEGFDNGVARDEPYFASTIVRVVRVLQRVLEIQDTFMDVLIPLLSEFDSAPIVGMVYTRSYFTRIDQALSFAPHYAPAIAAYVAFRGYPELVYLAVKILALLAGSNAFTNLAMLIDRSADSERILIGMRDILAMENMDDVPAAEAIMEESTGAGAPDADDIDAAGQATRLAVLDLLIQNTQQGKQVPNIAHLLLFGNIAADKIEDPHALGAQQSCIHVILDLLNEGVPRLRGKGKGRALASDPLFVTLPALAERCYRILHQICVHPRTSEAAMRYLRTREDFFARHLAAVPFKIPPAEDEPFIEVVYNDGSRVVSTIQATSPFLRLRALILDMVALELHVLTAKGHVKGVNQLLRLLFQSEDEYLEDELDGSDMLKPFHEVGQSHLRIIELVQSLDFDWSDSLAVEPADLEFFTGLNLASCIRVELHGCEVVDQEALLALLATARRALHVQGRIVAPPQVEKLSAETAYVMASCAVENHRREVAHATRMGYEAWKRLLDMILTKCFDKLPADQREGMLFDLLHVLPDAVLSNNVDGETAILLSEAILSVITRLRDDRRHQLLIRSASGNVDAGALPAERLYTLLRRMLECIVSNNRVELVRGNLYAALINYMHLIVPSTTLPTHRSLGSSVAVTSPGDVGEMALVVGGHFGSSRSGWSSITAGSLAIFKEASDRLLGVVARDAIDGTEVWKTVAFMLLNSLVQLAQGENTNVLLNGLVRHGVLSNFVQSLAESDARLQAVLKPDPEDLNTLYVYEAKMSFFIRVAESRQGADRLLEASILRTLARCEYLDSRPEADQAFVDQDSFLPSAVQRYHQLLMPTLQLVAAVLATLGQGHGTASKQVLEFLTSHRDTIVILLKNDAELKSLAVLEEMMLIISICESVLPTIPKTDLASTISGFGAIHAAILSLAAWCLGSQTWIRVIEPQTDKEAEDASVAAPGESSKSKFEVEVREKAHVLRQAVIAYLGTSSEFTEPEFSIVLSPLAAPSRKDERTHRITAAIPTMGDALEALNNTCGALSDVFRQIVDLSAEINAKDHIRTETLREIIDVPNLDVDDMDLARKQTLMAAKLAEMKTQAQIRAQTTLGSLEMLLLLLWRHLLYYADTHAHVAPSLALSRLAASQMNVNSESVRADVAGKMRSILQCVEGLTFDSENTGRGWRDAGAYVGMMCRRLKEAAGLVDEEGEHGT